MEEGDSTLLNKQSCLSWFVFLFLFFAQYIGSKESVCNAGDMGSIPRWEDPLEEGMATHSSILTGESHGQRSLAGYSSWGHKELDIIEVTEHEHI